MRSIGWALEANLRVGEDPLTGGEKPFPVLFFSLTSSGNIGTFFHCLFFINGLRFHSVNTN